MIPLQKFPAVVKHVPSYLRRYSISSGMKRGLGVTLNRQHNGLNGQNIADHGEAFGEWGIYVHPARIDFPCLTHVPWIETRATDERSYEPTLEPTNNDNESITGRLRFLGYR
jgi:hypothetical protein